MPVERSALSRLSWSRKTGRDICRLTRERSQWNSHIGPLRESVQSLPRRVLPHGREPSLVSARIEPRSDRTEGFTRRQPERRAFLRKGGDSWQALVSSPPALQHSPEPAGIRTPGPVVVVSAIVAGVGAAVVVVTAVAAAATKATGCSRVKKRGSTSTSPCSAPDPLASLAIPQLWAKELAFADVCILWRELGRLHDW